MNKNNISILGSTGSIGRSTLDVISRNPERFNVIALSANQDADTLLQQCLQFKPKYAVLVQSEKAQQLQQNLHSAGLQTKVLVGQDALVEIAQLKEIDCVVAAIVGAVGLLPTLAAATAGKKILLANKEALVMAGALFMQQVQQHGAILLPVDSEHNAIFQCLPQGYKTGSRCAGIKKIFLTASGGPFRQTPMEEFKNITPAQAWTHPKWLMGKKVSIDSATMMNKALEVIEAYWLFNIAPSEIKVLLHPQSIVHSLVEYKDGSVLAQLGNPDMRVPIAQALAWPERIDSGATELNLLTAGHLEFGELCLQRFPSLALAYEALRLGGTASTILNAANEVAVSAFIEGKINFMDIAKINEYVLTKLPSQAADNITAILAADTAARNEATNYLTRVLA